MSDEVKTTRLPDDICRTSAPNVVIRADGNQETEELSEHTMEGHFSTFNEWYEIDSWFEGHFLERIAPGAFKRTFNAAKSAKDKHRISVLLEHGFDPQVGDKPLGVPEELEEDSEGARYVVPLLDTTYNRDLVPALNAGAYGSSFRFRVIQDEWNNEPEPTDDNPQGIPERTITEVRVMEFGPTVFPANPSATAGLRSTTDEYYEKLRSKNPEAYEDVVARTSKIRGVSLLPDEVHSEDSQSEEHSEDPAPVESPGDSRSHSEDPPNAEHSEATGTAHETQDESRKDSDNSMSEHENEIERMSVTERRSRVEEIDSRFVSINKEYDGAVLPDDVQTEWNELLEERAGHIDAIEAAEVRAQQLEQIAAGEGAPAGIEKATPVRKARAGVGRKATLDDKLPRNLYNLEEYRSSARSLDELRHLHQAGAKRALEESVIPGVGVDPDEAKRNVLRLLETVDDKHGELARRILVTGSPVYRRAFGKAVMAGSDAGLSVEERAALAAGAGATGGFAIPFTLDPTVVLTSDGSINPLRQIARVVQITTTTWQAVTSAGVSVSRAGEAEEATDNAPTLAQPDATPTRVHGFIPFSIEVDQDWSALQSEMTMLLQEAKDDEEADSFINGDGEDDNPAGLIATLAAGSEVSGALTDGTVYALEEALPPRFRARGRFLGNKSTYNAIRQFGDTDGHALWERVGNGQPPELLGYPAHEASEMTTDRTTAGSRYLAFGDFSKFVIVDRVGMNVELIPHLFGTDNRYPTGQRGLYAIWRNTSVVLVDNAFRVATVPS